MDRLRRAAFETVARGTGFAGLAIVCILVGLSWNPPLAAKTGGILTLIAAATLTAKGHAAPTRDHRRTETWMMLEESERPPAAVAQQVTGTALQEAYYTFAIRAAGISAVLFAAAFVLAAALPPDMGSLR
ncbi:hypothetical protein [Chthonobacter rhizosphaerae]|uniref:hypothetical protein n=1 Tax=Chthonobacter rhizosphaerae TaxID=2735553 RepID=UPI0015EEB7F4|nr:hypothetical protein [Chthonobacter rhizosphaerae]